MKRIAGGLIVVALFVGAGYYFLHAGDSAPPPTRPLDPAMVNAPARVMNEVVVSVPSPAPVAAEKPADQVTVKTAPLGLEFEPLLAASPLVQGRHKAFEDQPRDESWASAMEENWKNAFAANTALAQYGTPTISCRTNKCEVQLVTREASTLDRNKWMTLLNSGAIKKPTGDAQVQAVNWLPSMMLSSMESDGATVILYNLTYPREGPAAR